MVTNTALDRDHLPVAMGASEAGLRRDLVVHDLDQPVEDLLAADDKITDQSIVRQIVNRDPLR